MCRQTHTHPPLKTLLAPAQRWRRKELRDGREEPGWTKTEDKMSRRISQLGRSQKDLGFRDHEVLREPGDRTWADLPSARDRVKSTRSGLPTSWQQWSSIRHVASFIPQANWLSALMPKSYLSGIALRVTVTIVICIEIVTVFSSLKKNQVKNVNQCYRMFCSYHRCPVRRGSYVTVCEIDPWACR